MSAERKLFLILCIAMIIMPVAGSPAGVMRTITGIDGDNAGDGEYLVTLTPQGIAAGGVVETMPDGVDYTGSSSPESHVRVSGNMVAFVIYESEPLTYTLTSGSETTPEISGVWEDFVTEKTGIVSEGAVSAPVNEPLAGDASGTQQSPGFGFIPVVSALLLAVLVCICRRGSL
ncbi:MAG: hypothetical protein KAW93_05455 [Methanogenium sp.]|nr:hypothetical protein [Methanogenium sp.]